ncbi:MAG: ATP-binding cassette domain-containing protein [Christensenellales bacterium]|jgi:ABC-2 type transport system ATP-binding protein
MTERTPPAIEVIGLKRRYGQEWVLKGIDLTLEPGKIHGIIGKNGSGKTLLLKCICGFVPPTEGKVLVDGRQVGKDVDFPPEVGMIIETPGFLPYYSARRNLEILASIRRKVGRGRIDEVLRYVGLDPQNRKGVAKYSMGMRQRLGLAQALMEYPSILVLDEPMNGLDKQGVAWLRGLLSQQRDQGTTILMASHSMEDVDLLCDTVHEMDGGELTDVKVV